MYTECIWWLCSVPSGNLWENVNKLVRHKTRNPALKNFDRLAWATVKLRSSGYVWVSKSILDAKRSHASHASCFDIYWRARSISLIFHPNFFLGADILDPHLHSYSFKCFFQILVKTMSHLTFCSACLMFVLMLFGYFRHVQWISASLSRQIMMTWSWVKRLEPKHVV